jgi:hypothetical protein
MNAFASKSPAKPLPPRVNLPSTIASDGPVGISSATVCVIVSPATWNTDRCAKRMPGCCLIASCTIEPSGCSANSSSAISPALFALTCT